MNVKLMNTDISGS